MSSGQVRPRRDAVVIFSRPPEIDARGKRLQHLERFFRRLGERALKAALACRRAEVVVVGALGVDTEGARTFRLEQRGESAPIRFVNALEDVARLGFERVVAIGTDVPGLRAATLRAAFARLDEGAELVLGPAADGGAYLIGARASVISSLAGMPWGTSDVLQALCAASPRVALLDEELDDIDDARGLRRLAACQALPRRLAALLRALESDPALDVGCRVAERRADVWATLRPVTRRGPPRGPDVALPSCA